MRSLKEIMAGLSPGRRRKIEKRADELAQELRRAVNNCIRYEERLSETEDENERLRARIVELESTIDSRDRALGFTGIATDSAPAEPNCAPDPDCDICEGTPWGNNNPCVNCGGISVKADQPDAVP